MMTTFLKKYRIKKAGFPGEYLIVSNYVCFEMPRITHIPGFRHSELLTIPTLCDGNQELTMDIWRKYFGLTNELHELGDIRTIDTTGIDRLAASLHNAKYLPSALECRGDVFRAAATFWRSTSSANQVWTVS